MKLLSTCIMIMVMKWGRWTRCITKLEEWRVMNVRLSDFPAKNRLIRLLKISRYPGTGRRVPGYREILQMGVFLGNPRNLVVPRYCESASYVPCIFCLYVYESQIFEQAHMRIYFLRLCLLVKKACFFFELFFSKIGRCAIDFFVTQWVDWFDKVRCSWRKGPI